MRFTSFPSVVTWNHGMRKHDGVGGDGSKCSGSMFSALPSVVTWTLHRGWKPGESDPVDGVHGGMDVDEGGKSMDSSRSGIEEGGGRGLDEVEEGNVVEEDCDGSEKEAAGMDLDGSGSESEVRILGVYGEHSDTDEDSTGG
eukprot:1335366-Rhodomonas_salina.1